MKVVAWVGAVMILAGVVVLAVAGVTAATAVLVTAVALVGMIVLGGVVGGRHTPGVAPHAGRPAPDGGIGPEHDDSAGPGLEARDGEPPRPSP